MNCLFVFVCVCCIRVFDYYCRYSELPYIRGIGDKSTLHKDGTQVFKVPGNGSSNTLDLNLEHEWNCLSASNIRIKSGEPCPPGFSVPAGLVESGFVKTPPSLRARK